MTDSEYVLDQLRAGPRDAMQIISASIRDRGVGATIHSRVADLRAQGHKITCAIEGKTRKGRDRWVYRLVEDAGAVEPPARVGRVPGPLIPQAVALPDAAIPGQLSLIA